MSKKKGPNAPQEGRVMGNKIVAKGYQNDSMGLPIDPGSYYDFRHHGPRVLTMQRAGLPVPRNPKPLIRTATDGNTG